MTKITQLPADTTPTSDDLIVTVNDPGGTPATRKVTLANLLNALAIAVKNVAQAWLGGQRSGVTALTQSSGTLTIDASLNNFYTVTLSANITTLTITNIAVGTNFELFVAQNATGGYTIAKPSTCLLPAGATTFPIATTASVVSNIVFRSANGTTLRCDVGGGTGGYS